MYSECNLQKKTLDQTKLTIDGVRCPVVDQVPYNACFLYKVVQAILCTPCGVATGDYQFIQATV